MNLLIQADVLKADLYFRVASALPYAHRQNFLHAKVTQTAWCAHL